MLRAVLATLILLMGAALLGGGVWLFTLGGTWGYVALGLLLTVLGVLLLARRKLGLAAYGAAIIFALGWGVWEVRLYW